MKFSANLVRAPLPRTADLWADENRVLPQGSAEPGPWRSSRNPYMIPIVRAFSYPAVRRIIFIMGSQMGKSASIFNVIGHRLDDDPAPIIYVGPTQSNIDSVVEPKIVEMFKNSESLWMKLAKGQKSTKHHKRVSGVSLRFAWAGSATELASDSAAIGLVDELDRMEQDVKGEGSPVELTEARTSVYADSKIGVTSTPTEGEIDVLPHPETGVLHWEVSDNVGSPVWKLWQEGSRHEWAVPCPECKEYFIPRMRLLWWPEGSSANSVEETARLNCPCCGGQIETKMKPWMNKHGIFIAPGQKAQPCDEGQGVEVTDFNSGKTEFIEYGDIAGEKRGNLTFWVSGIMSFSSKKSFGFLASKFISANNSGDIERIQGVVNTDFGELFRVSGDAPKWQEVMERASNYVLGNVPEEVNVLTCGVDVQKNRLVYVIRGFGEGLTSWLIDKGELWGETDQADVWDQLSKLLSRKYADLEISKMCVDSGYMTDYVYAFCRDHRGVALPTKGQETLDKPYRATNIDVNIRGKTIRNGIQLWNFNSDMMKVWVHSRIEWPDGEPGAWYLPSDIDEDYCKQIVAEQRTTKANGAPTWIKTARDNHFLDAEALSYLAVRILGGANQAIRRRVKMEPSAKRERKFVKRHNSWMKR